MCSLIRALLFAHVGFLWCNLFTRGSLMKFVGGPKFNHFTSITAMTHGWMIPFLKMLLWAFFSKFCKSEWAIFGRGSGFGWGWGCGVISKTSLRVLKCELLNIHFTSHINKATDTNSNGIVKILVQYYDGNTGKNSRQKIDLQFMYFHSIYWEQDVILEGF